MKSLLKPVAKQNHRVTAFGVLSFLAVSAAALLAAPLMMPDSYSWFSHTTSESAAQGVHGAWLARLGFVAFGLSVLWIATSLRTMWGRGAVFFHACFGVFMTAAAAFSTRPWMPNAAFDPIEDFLHSFTATAMGFAFAFGVLLMLLQRERSDRAGRSSDGIAILAATGIPVAMAFWPTVEGLIQRLMFLTAYLWYGKEAFRIFTLSKEASTKAFNQTPDGAG